MVDKGVTAVAASAELVAGWRLDQERRGIMASSIETRCPRVRSFARWLDPRSLGAATEADVQLFLDGKRNRLGDPISARTRYGWVSTLHCFYRWAVHAGHAQIDPTMDIVRPKLRRTLPRPISDGDLSMAVTLAPPQVERWLVLAAYAGLRCAEIAGLERDQVLWDVGLLHVHGKGGRERMVPMHPRVVDSLASWPMPRRNGPIFRRPQGGSWPPSHLSSTGGQYLRSIGVDASMHQLRHWFGSRTYRACRDIRVVQELLGHSDPATTAIYTAWAMEDAEVAVLALT